MDERFQNTKGDKMICHKCGGTQLVKQCADLPFRLDTHKILVVKDTPSRICASCGEILLSDAVLKEIDGIIDSIHGVAAELEVVRYAA